ncbi:MAG TPA: glycoside hydrolase family 5 protein [Acholeplasmataceae bacterium]|nr:glycoside hydrolase family 5 protein [Acholeplasmataceae bacterium]
MKKITSFLLVFLFSIFFVGCTEKEDDIEKTLKEMTSLEVTELMGNGINLGNTMEAYGRATVGITGDVSQYETAWGQPVTTKEMIKGMKEAGFDTLRIPVAWTNTIDYKNGNYDINPAYLKRVAEITDYALEEDMFVIINEHWSGGWWGMFGSSDQNLRKVANDLYISMWTQIGNHFKDYSYRLIFESANEELGLRLNDEIDGVPGVLTDDETYSETNRINQLFVDTIRNLGSKNSDRFLLIAGYNTDINRTLDERFQMPTDTAEAKLLLSVHYYDPSDYTLQSVSTWGTEDDFVYQNEKFASLEKFIEAGYGIIIGEYGVLPTPDDKIKSNIIDYTKNLLDNCDLYGYVPVLWDTSTFFIRKDLEMYDEEFAELFASRSYAVQKDISKEEVKNAAQASLDEALAAAQQRDIDSGYADFKNKAIAWIMFASSDWGINYSVGDEYKPRSRTDGVTGTDVTIEAVGEFTVALDFTGSGAGSANSVGFMALAIYNGEKFYPDHIIEIKELKFNDEIYDIKNKIYYTTSDDQNTTRVNIYNVWVTKVPEDARVLNPRLQNYATPVIIDPEKLSEIRTVEITFVFKAR